MGCGAGYSIETVPCCEHSFAASPGWDAVTGLGSPNFEILSNLVLNNKTAFPNLGAYPVGATLSDDISASGSSGDDDSETTKDLAISGLVIAAVAFVVGLIAAAVLIRFF